MPQFDDDSNINEAPACGGDLLVKLQQAARAGRLEEVRSLLAMRPPLDDGGAIEATPLMLAAVGGHDRVAAALLDAGASIDFRIGMGKQDVATTALMDAARGGHLAVVRLLVERGADVFASGDRHQRNMNARWYAINFGKSEVAKYLQEVEKAQKRTAKQRVAPGVEGFDGDAFLLLVEAPADAVAKRLAALAGLTTVRAGVLGTVVDLGERSYLLVQRKGLRWTVVEGLTRATATDPLDEWGKALSASPGPAAFLWNAGHDPIGFRYEYYRGGRLVESFEHGADGLIEMLEEDVTESARRRAAALRAGGGTAFWSALRTFDQVEDPQKFAVEFARARGAFVPDATTGMLTARKGELLSLPGLDERSVEGAVLVTDGKCA